LVWELLTRKRPFEGIEAHEVLRLVRQGTRPPLPESDTGIHKELVQRCWAQNPTDRPSFQQILEHLKPLVDDDITHVMQLRSHPEIYLSAESDEHAALKLIRKSRQGFYHSLPPSVLYCRVWNAVLTTENETDNLQLFIKTVAAPVEDLYKDSYVMVNEYGKFRAVFCYGSPEKIKTADMRIGALPLEHLQQNWSLLRNTVCSPVIRENLELAEYGIQRSEVPKAALVIQATLAHDKSRPYEGVEQLSAAMQDAEGWLGALLICDQSSGTFSLVGLYREESDMRKREHFGLLQRFLQNFRETLASLPIVEHYRVTSCQHH